MVLRYIATTVSATTAARPALFLDRDGVLNRRVIGGYVTRPEGLELLPTAVEAARVVGARGTPIIIVSNQGAISRGLATAGEILAVNAALLIALAARGVAVDGVYVCPHHPDAPAPSLRECLCRKPKPGMLLQAARDLCVDLQRSVLVGDQQSDAGAARSAGLAMERTLLVSETTDSIAWPAP